MLFPYPELHRIELTIIDNIYVWKCAECGREVRVSPFLVINKGNCSATHMGTSGGLHLTAGTGGSRIG